MGGAKVSDKIGVLKALMEKADAILIGGAMANTFFKAQGIPDWQRAGSKPTNSISRTRSCRSCEATRREISAAGRCGRSPGDRGRRARRETPAGCRRNSGITDGWQAVDIGTATIALFEEEIAKAKTILWNGPVGIFEIPDFAEGTIAIAEAMAQVRARRPIIGGGDSVTAVKQAGLADKMTFISTGGGASLELLEGKELPGVAALTDK